MTLGKSIIRCVLATSVVVLASPSSVSAGTLTPLTASEWSAAVSNQNVVNFDTAGGGYTPPVMSNYFTFSTYKAVVQGVEFTSYWQGNPQYLIASNYNSWSTGTVLKTQAYTAGTNYIHILFPMPTTAFAADLVTGGSYGTFTITAGGDSYTTPTVSQEAMRTFAFTFAAPVTSVDLFYTNSYQSAVVDNIIYATTGSTGGTGGETGPGGGGAETPEAATMLLCAAGLYCFSKKLPRRAQAGA